MSHIPLDLERRCEQRSAARFCRPTSLAAPQSQPQQQQQLSEPAKAKRKTRRVKAAGLRSAPAVGGRDPNPPPRVRSRPVAPPPTLKISAPSLPPVRSTSNVTFSPSSLPRLPA